MAGVDPVAGWMVGGLLGHDGNGVVARQPPEDHTVNRAATVPGNKKLFIGTPPVFNALVQKQPVVRYPQYEDFCKTHISFYIAKV